MTGVECGDKNYFVTLTIEIDLYLIQDATHLHSYHRPMQNELTIPCFKARICAAAKEKRIVFSCNCGVTLVEWFRARTGIQTFVRLMIADPQQRCFTTLLFHLKRFLQTPGDASHGLWLYCFVFLAYVRLFHQKCFWKVGLLIRKIFRFLLSRKPNVLTSMSYAVAIKTHWLK